MKIDKNDQPDLNTKIDCLMKGGHPIWDYTFNVPPVTTRKWNHQDWINYIGDNWFRKNSAQETTK